MNGSKVRGIVTCIGIAFLLALMPLTAAAQTSGIWTQPDIEVGDWYECFAVGPGSVGTVLGADGATAQWTLSGFVLQSVTPLTPGGSDPMIYETVYTGGSLSVNAGAWGSAFTVSNMQAVNTTYSYLSGNLEFSFSGTGLIDGTGSRADVVATFGPAPSTPIVGGICTGVGSGTGHGETLGTVTLQIYGAAIPVLSPWGVVALMAALAAAGLGILRLRS